MYFLDRVVLPVGLYLNGIVIAHDLVPASVANLPLGARVVAYFILADFGHYWIHRLTHTKYFWRVHKWHHSPTYMYWLGGVRTTIPDFFLVNTPYFLAFQLLYISPWWMATAMAVSSIFQNDWMHMNVTWRSKWLEWIIVTPRYHHIHHSDDPQFYMKNLASLFTVWDRLFGTYVNPDKVTTNLAFGTGQKDNPVRTRARGVGTSERLQVNDTGCDFFANRVRCSVSKKTTRRNALIRLRARVTGPSL